MKQIFIIMRYTFKDAVKKKAFKISTIIIILIIAALCAVPRFLSFSDDSPEQAPENAAAAETSEKYYYIDEEHLISGGAEALKNAFPYAEIIEGSETAIPDYDAEIKNDASVSAIIIYGAQSVDEIPSVEVVTKNFMSGANADTIADVLSQAYIADMLSQAGVDADTAALIKTQLPYTSRSAGDMNISGYIMGILVTILVFFAVYYYGYGVSMSIATEKTSRVMETLVVSAKPSNILIGKCIGMGLLGLCQFASVLLSGVIFYNLFIPEGFTLMGMPLSFDAFTPVSALLLCVYFILGYTLYAVMNAVCGASVSKIEDLNSAMMPVMFIALISFYVGYFAALSGTMTGTAFQKAASLVPFCSPFVLPFRLLNENVPASEVVISLLLLAATIVIITIISIRIYSASVLHYGKRLKLKDSIRRKI